MESRAYAGLGHASRCAGDYSQAKQWHERQLDVALATRDKIGEGRACSNLGIVYQLLGKTPPVKVGLELKHRNIRRRVRCCIEAASGASVDSQEFAGQGGNGQGLWKHWQRLLGSRILRFRH